MHEYVYIERIRYLYNDKEVEITLRLGQNFDPDDVAERLRTIQEGLLWGDDQKEE